MAECDVQEAVIVNRGFQVSPWELMHDIVVLWLKFVTVFSNGLLCGGVFSSNSFKTSGTSVIISNVSLSKLVSSLYWWEILVSHVSSLCHHGEHSTLSCLNAADAVFVFYNIGSGNVASLCPYQQHKSRIKHSLPSNVSNLTYVRKYRVVYLIASHACRLDLG